MLKEINRYITFTILIIFTLSINISVYAKNKSVKYSSCVDGDTIKVVMDKEKVTVRLLAVDTPETKHPDKGVEPYGKEASEFTCNLIKNASKIELEFDKNSDELDKYSRYLAWVFIDGKLLQEELIKKGYAKTAYLYGNYKYTKDLKVLEENAKTNRLGIWSNYKEDYSEYIYIAVVIILVLFGVSTTKMKKIKKILKN